MLGDFVLFHIPYGKKRYTVLIKMLYRPGVFLKSGEQEKKEKDVFWINWVKLLFKSNIYMYTN